ncbi:GNAT family N-acetyltransferase [Proteiniclasticum sp. SCR006]|uniref:GNAT family N-acetyltransferase n=1 Tax=Proteiniclasticum aestuarii TaxID=2817862 RepID=A0A939HEB9_9CLOT|nr:GNAT family N-acetyltransferase [Proteiniclasticum aestuarii]MBO1265748.1 GNAT family N-acetyltransferase [Proteiniclasticum aestuarii]
MKVVVKPFDALSVKELYDIIQLRVEVFILEQTCLYQDLDGNDDKAYHVQIVEGDDIAAYARVFRSGIKYPAASIGRVITSPKYRGKGYGDILMKESIRCAEELGETHIMLSSQSYAQEFYARHGFKRTSRESYLEDDIPHVEMEYGRGE